MGLVTSDNEVVYIEEIHTYEEKIEFKIEENYDDFVKGNESDFKASIKNQLISILNCDPLNIRELQVSPGSILVDFLLVGSNEMEADELKQSHAELAALLEAGALKLEFPIGKQMTVPKQYIKTCQDCPKAENLDGEDMTLLILGSVLLGIILIVLVCIIGKSNV